MDELLEHPLGHLVVGDNALAQGADRDDVAGRAAQHGLRVRADLQQLARILINGHHARLVEHDALVLYIDQNRRGTEVDTDVLCQ